MTVQANGKIRARKLYVKLGDNEWGNETMIKVAHHYFAADPTSR
jgi:hypothetical protein